MSQKTIALLVSAIFVFGVCLYAGIYLVRSQGCVDGRGTDDYFDKTELTSSENMGQFDISNIEVVAQYSQSCAIKSYRVRGNWGLKKVDQDEFSAYIERYNADCRNCLLVYKTGWPYSGEIFEVAADRHICSTGKRTFETCIILQLTGSTVTPEVADDEQNGAQPLKLTLRPAQDAYDLEEARVGNIILIAGLENSGNTPLILAHPNVCFPHDYQQGQSFHMAEREDKSEISLLITLPNETQISLRHNLLRMFEPGNKDHLIIQPGESREIRFGWFAPASLGQWDDDSGGAITDPIFSQKGTYHIDVKFTNLFPKAYIFDEAGISQMIDTAWTGEVQSTTIIVIQ